MSVSLQLWEFKLKLPFYPAGSKLISLSSSKFKSTNITKNIHKNENWKCLDTAVARCAHFTLLCFSVDGVAGSEAASFLKRLAYCLAAHWERSYECWYNALDPWLTLFCNTESYCFVCAGLTHSMAFSEPGGWCKYWYYLTVLIF